MKYIILTLIIFPVFVLAKEPPAEKLRGVFLAVGVGPRLPISSFSSSTDLGYGINLELSYSDNEFLPLFLYTRIGFATYPGSQDFYKVSDYNNFSTNALPVNLGARYFFPPLFDEVVLLIPFAELSASYTYFEKLHEFKPSSGRTNFLEDVSKFGFSAGVGLSMFLAEFVITYNYFKENQTVDIDLRVRLPLFVSY